MREGSGTRNLSAFFKNIGEMQVLVLNGNTGKYYFLL